MTVHTLTITAPPGNLPVTLEEVKAQARYDLPDEDALILGYARAATEHAEIFLNRALITRSYQLALDDWAAEIRLPMPDLISVQSIKYDDADGTEQTADPALYQVSTARLPGTIKLNPNQTWPALTTAKDMDRIRIDYTAGYGPNPTDVPTQIRQGVLYAAAHYFTERQPVSTQQMREIPGTASALLWPHRVVPI